MPQARPESPHIHKHMHTHEPVPMCFYMCIQVRPSTNKEFDLFLLTRCQKGWKQLQLNCCTISHAVHEPQTKTKAILSQIKHHY